MIEAQKLTKKFGDHVVIQPRSFTIAAGAFVVITGPSGSGKTTLLNILSLLEQPSGGVLRHQGRSHLSRREIRQLKRDDYAYLFQNYGLIEEESVSLNLRMAMRGVGKYEQTKRMDQALQTVGLQGYEQRPVFQLSGGQQQRVALARVLVKQARCIFADEPTGNLDESNRERVFRLLKGLHANGTTIILVTHDPYMAKLATKTINLSRN
ncbi:ATP-binding cassette domain-containing protein [Brochothrix campestris]|uniref:ABC transporter ATP-binding protein n=1 Tax=Brochothrix campestris FSL F6-1037 TaxID=1265861 RepID=W7CZ65_9LIST|nr:ATP-binding cassette domain-containing protein [Brochothrix campestris]EUJ42065.1 ABC transporter ATP-binding protein [Brochothrix campestris FSL F6-1037]